MKIQQQTTKNISPSHKGISPYNITAGLEENVLLNKALFDLTGSDIPWVIMANNKEERRERINRGALSVMMVFISPLVALPFINRFAMKNVTKLTPKFFSPQYNAIKLSNKYLVNAKETEKGLELLAKESSIGFIEKFWNKITGKKNIDTELQPKPDLNQKSRLGLLTQQQKMNTALVATHGEHKLNIKELLANSNNSYDVLRKKIITAKNIVLGFDLLMVAGVFGHIGFYNDWQTRKKTGRIGFSAELEMADKEVIEKRAKRQEEIREAKYAGFLSVLGATAIALPFAIKKGLSSTKPTKFANFVKEHAPKFDYVDAIFMSRLAMALSFIAAHTGVFLASRNKSEMKDNAIRSTTSISIFFLGDLLLASLLGQASDKVLKTKIINRENKGGALNKILPPVKTMKALKQTADKRTKAVATGIFWFNFVSLAALMGFAVPSLINKLVKKDVAKDAEKAQKTT